MPPFETAIQHLNPRIGEIGWSVSSQFGKAESGLSALFLLILIPAAVAFFFIIRSVYRHTIGEKMKTTLLEDYKKEAEDFERRGKYVSAANIYESKLKDMQRAAALYERGGDYRKAAELYEFRGEASKAREMYERDGNLEDAAEVSFREGEYEAAARFYDKAGKKFDAALVLERAGKKMAAVRSYREAGDYLNASRLLEEEGMMKEATEMFGLSIRDKRPDSSNMEVFYSYAFKLEKSGQTLKALEVYKEIDQADPAFRDVRERLQALDCPTEEEKAPEGMTTIRSLIRSGSMDPKNSLKLWLHILRSLQNSYSAGRDFGLLSPENIVIDTRNKISFLERRPASAYTAPETVKGIKPDARADIYSMGVILYEMLTGSLEGLGSTRVTDHIQDLPEWLDEMVVCCIRKVREDRYPNIESIFTDIRRLSKAQKESGESV